MTTHVDIHHLDLTPRLIETAKLNEPLSRHCSLRIGGPAEIWLEPHSLEELRCIIRAAHQHHLPLSAVGLGSNTLFPDEGIRGFVLKFSGALAAVTVLEQTPDDLTTTRVHIGAGKANAHVVRDLLRLGLVNHEFLKLIPGTFGGSIVMNAGTKEQEVCSILESATVIVPNEDGTVDQLEMTPEQMHMSYRHTSLPDGAIVAGGIIRVQHGDVEAAGARVKFDKERRNTTQPYRLASVGSTFANPPGDYAGRLIEAAGLKGTRIGGARISDLHANFFINEEGATAHDFLSLMALARVRVRAQFQIELRPEVWFVGFDGNAQLAQLEQELA